MVDFYKPGGGGTYDLLVSNHESCPFSVGNQLTALNPPFGGLPLGGGGGGGSSAGGPGGAPPCSPPCCCACWA